MNIEDLVKNEIKFCEEIDCIKNKNNQFIYHSTDGNSIINLPHILNEYKEWLIENDEHIDQMRLLTLKI